MIEEALHQKLIKALTERLPNALASASATPFVYQSRDGQGRHAQVTELHRLEAPQEVLSAEGVRLYFPSIIVQFAGSTYTETEDECGDDRIYGEAAFTVDIALDHGDEQLLTWLWHRYASAVQGILNALSVLDLATDYDGKTYEPQAFVTGKTITSLSTDSQTFARRGTVELVVRF